MGILPQDREAFGFICDGLGKIGYKVSNIKIYKLSMSFFLALDVSFIEKHKEKIAKLFYNAFQQFPDTSAFFVFGKKDEIEDIGKEVTDDFFERYYETKEQKTIQFQNDIKDVFYNTNRAEHIWNFIEKKQQVDGLSCYGKETNDNKFYESQSSYKTKKLAMAA